ncbi:MAG TPA: hypothetical protein VFW39_12890 [Sphingomicrobium sp.]|nr:hypothetical protein [Sphingomicrobium sp.]
MNKIMIAALAATSMLAISGCKQSATGNGAATENASTPAAAANSIDGTWKADVTTAKWDQKPEQYLLQNGKYDCKSCTPPWSVPADGAFHPIAGNPYVDQVSIKVVDDKTVQQENKLKGRDTGGATLKVSADGNTLGIDFKDMTNPSGPPSTGHVDETRVAPAPAGAHAISGSWKPAKAQNVNAETLTTTFKTDDDMLHMSSPSGSSYDAKLDGSDTPIKGDVAGTTASVKKLSDGSYQETDKRGGKVVSVTTFTVGSDGKLNVVSENKENGSKFSYSADKS